MYQKDLIGKEVIGSDAWKVGTVAGLIVDPNSWQVTSVEVAVDEAIIQELRAHGATKGSPIVINVDQIAGVSDKMVLKINKAGLSKLVTQVPPAVATTRSS
jgi:sporulation protein YlmC with PRC-barrel domain